MILSRKSVGDIGERAAARYLRKKGFRILERNRHFSHNELDIVAANKQYILFVEVKTRRQMPHADSTVAPSSAVNRGKQHRTVAAAKDYLRLHPTEKQPRMDVIEIILNEEATDVIRINHIEDAFGAR